MVLSLENLKKEYDTHAFFTSDKECMEYLLAINLQPLEEYALFVTGGRAWLFTPHEAAACGVEEVRYEGYSNKKYQNKTANILTKLNEFPLPPTLDTVGEKQIYTDYFHKRNTKANDATEKIMEASMIKNEQQIDAIRFCADMNEKAYMTLPEIDAAGETELSMFRYIQSSNMNVTSFANSMIYDFLAGVRTAQVSGFPTNYILKDGDTLIADLLPRHNGVYADMTRTFFIGKPGNKQIYIYEILCEAIQRAEELLKPGTASAEIYESIYTLFKKYGLSEHFPHHAGHGLGMGYYDAPYFLKEEERELEKNMVVAIEPGLYFEKEFGIRIENNYVITESGANRLGNLPLAIENYMIPFCKGRSR